MNTKKKTVSEMGMVLSAALLLASLQPAWTFEASANAGESMLDFDDHHLIFGDASFIPALHASEPVHMGIQLPARANQVLIPSWQGAADLSAEIEFSYDADNLYLSATVTDDQHHPVAAESMWSGDSIQIAFSPDGATYGAEYGLAAGASGPEVWRWNAGTAVEDKDVVTLLTQRIGTITTYEATLPWDAIMASSPVGVQSSLNFSLLINDNDGNGREGYVEWTQGIGLGKHPEKFGALELIDTTATFSAFADAPETIVAEEDGTYAVYILNYGTASRDFELELPFQQVTAALPITVPGKTIFRKTVEVQWQQPGEYSGEVLVTDLATSQTQSRTVELKVSPNPTVLEGRFNDLELGLADLDGLLSQAETLQLATDYETVNATVIRNFVGYGREDILQGELERANYVATELERLLGEATSQLTDYINAVKTPLAVPRYVTDRSTIDQYSFMADTLMAGESTPSKRPVFFTGYGHFGQVKADIPKFEDYGTNLIQIEIGPNGIIVPEEPLPGWAPSESGGVQAESELDQAVYHGGAASLHISNASSYGPHVFYNLSQWLTVEPNTTYEVSAWVKGNGVQNAWIGGGSGWGDRLLVPHGTYGWQQITAQFTTGPNDNSYPFLILSEDVTPDLWIDDISFVKVGTSTNLLRNGDFEEIGAPNPAKGYRISTDPIVSVQQTLQQAAEHNVAVSLLISPHYFPAWVLEEWPETQSDSIGFIRFNIEAAKSREIIEDYLRTLIPMVKNYESLHNIVLSNESTYHANLETAHLGEWQTYLETKYTGIADLNLAYGTSYAAFSEVPMPQTESATPQFYDYVVFNNELFSEWHSWMADIVHELAPDIPVNAKIMNYAWGGNGLNLGVDVEQFAEFSQISGNDAYNFYGWGIPGYMNMFKYYDLQASIKEMPVFNSEDHIIQDWDTNYIPEMVGHARTNLWQGAIHNRTATTYWVWERTYNDASDFNGSIMHRPDVTAAIGRTNLDLNRLAEEVTAFQEDTAKSAILYSIPSLVYQARTPDVVDRWSTGAYVKKLNAFYEALNFSGQKVGFVTEKQAALQGLEKHELVVVPNATHVSADTLTALLAYVQQGGKLVITGADALKYNELNQLLPATPRSQLLSHANTIVIPATADAAAIREEMIDLLGGLDLMKVELIDVNTDELVQNVEWRSVVKDGKLLINAANYGWEDYEVEIVVDGEPLSAWKNLLTGETVTNANTLLLAGNDPVLLSIDLAEE